MIESGGGQARQIGADLAAAALPQSGRRPAIRCWCSVAPPRGCGASADWFTIPVQEGPARKTGAFAALAAQRLRVQPG